MAYTLDLTCAYEGTDFTRIYRFDVDDTIATADIVSGVEAINASLSAGTADGLDEFFVADDFDGTNGKLSRITKVETNVNTSTVIYPAGGE